MDTEAIRSYRDLRVWQGAMDFLVERCYRVTQKFPKEEMFGMTVQIRRASASVPVNIAKGYGRESRGEYIQFLRITQRNWRPICCLPTVLGFCPNTIAMPF